MMCLLLQRNFFFRHDFVPLIICEDKCRFASLALHLIRIDKAGELSIAAKVKAIFSISTMFNGFL